MTDHSDLIAELRGDLARMADGERQFWNAKLTPLLDALSSQSLSLSEAREERDEQERLVRVAERLKDKAYAKRDAADRQRDIALDALKGVVFWLEGALQCKDWHWDVDQGAMAAEAMARARSVLENGKARLADAPSNPSDPSLSSLRKGAEEIEVTDEMIEAGKEAANGWTDRYMDGAEFVNWDEALPDIFRRMLALVSGSREEW